MSNLDIVEGILEALSGGNNKIIMDKDFIDTYAYWLDTIGPKVPGKNYLLVFALNRLQEYRGNNNE
jgi:hypothetical protein